MNKAAGILLILLILASLFLVFSNFQGTKATNSFVTQWTQTYSVPNATATCVVQTANGGYTIAGTNSQFNYDFSAFDQFPLLIIADSNGNLVWNKITPSDIGFDASVDSLLQTNDGGYVFSASGIGTEEPTPTYSNIIKTDSLGNLTWNDAYGLLQYSRSLTNLIQTTDGNIAWGGEFRYLGTDYVFLNKTDLSDNQIWGHNYGNLGTANCLIQTSDGGFLLAGNSAGNSFVMKTDSSGNQVWIKNFGSISSSALIQTSDGGYALEGITSARNTILYKIDSSGNLQWTQTYTGIFAWQSSSGYVSPLVQTIDGGFLLAQNNVLYRTDSYGNILLTQPFNASINDIIKTSDQNYVLAGTTPSNIDTGSAWLAKVSLGSVDDWTMFHHDLQHSANSSSAAPETNSTLFAYQTGNSVSSSPAIANGLLYIGSDDGNIYALNAASGTLVWNYQTYYPVGSSPAVSQGLVYAGSTNGKVYALNATTGGFVWSYQTGSYVYSSPAVANGILYIGSDDNKTYALNATTGALVWSYQTGSYVGSSPALGAGLVYIGSYDNKTYALNSNTGSLVWSYTTGGYIASCPALAGNIVYVGSNDGKIYALNANTGALAWSYQTGSSIVSSPAVTQGLVYVGASNGKVYALNANTGNLAWIFQANNGIESSPAVAGGVVYVGSDDGNLYALAASSGALVWSYQTGSAIVSCPAIDNGIVYVGAQNGKVYAFNGAPLPTPTPTATPTATPTPTPTVTPTATPTPTPTPSIMPTPTPKPSPTPTSTPTPSPTPTTNPSPSPSPTLIQSSPIIGTISDGGRVQVQIFSLQTSSAIAYYPYTPKSSGYIWAWIDISIKNIASTGTIDINPIFASLKDNRNSVYTGEQILTDPEGLQPLYLNPQASQRGNIYFEIPAGDNIASFTWYDYTSNLVIPAPTPNTTPSPVTSATTQPKSTPSPTSSPSSNPISTIAPTSAPTGSPSLTNTQSFQQITTVTGASDQTTNYFNVPSSEWALNWTYSSSTPTNAVFSFDVYQQGNTIPVDVIMAPQNQSSGVSYVQNLKPGNYYIKTNVTNLDSYTINVEQATPSVPEVPTTIILLALFAVTTISVIIMKKQLTSTTKT